MEFFKNMVEFIAEKIATNPYLAVFASCILGVVIGGVIIFFYAEKIMIPSKTIEANNAIQEKNVAIEEKSRLEESNSKLVEENKKLKSELLNYKISEGMGEDGKGGFEHKAFDKFL